MEYMCIQEFSFENDYDYTGEYCTVTKGTKWKIGTDNFVGADVHLDDDEERWIEISWEDLRKYFVPLVYLKKAEEITNVN